MKRKELFLGIIVFVFVAATFYCSPVHYLSDSRFSLLMDEAVLEYGTPDMIRYKVPRGQGVPFVNHSYLWTMDLIKGRLLYVFPWGGALLALPEVAMFEAAGIRVAPNRVYDEGNEMKVQKILTALVCASTIWVFFQMALSLLPVGWALLISLTAAFGTQIWSSASRSLWPQTWYVLLIAIAIWLMMSDRRRPIVLGTILAWTCFVRVNAPPIVGLISAYLLLEYGPSFFLRYAITGALWTLLFVVTNIYFLGIPYSAAYPLSELALRHDFFWTVGGVLLSPSRGLFIFVPIVLLPLYLSFRYWRGFRHKRLALVALLAIGLHVLILASYGDWWGGGSYGPRDLLEAVPWFVLLAILGTRSALDDPVFELRTRPLFAVVVLFLLVVSIAMNAAGALSTSTLEWNDNPQVNQHPERLWDWRRPQFLAWLHD